MGRRAAVSGLATFGVSVGPMRRLAVTGEVVVSEGTPPYCLVSSPIASNTLPATRWLTGTCRSNSRSAREGSAMGR